jgi:hypothetical protein
MANCKKPVRDLEQPYFALLWVADCMRQLEHRFREVACNRSFYQLSGKPGGVVTEGHGHLRHKLLAKSPHGGFKIGEHFAGSQYAQDHIVRSWG